MEPIKNSARIIPQIYEDIPGATRVLEESFKWRELSEVLKEYRPVGLGLVMPFSWQMHWYAYKEACAEGIITAVAMPTNPSALSGLMKGIAIDAVLSNEAGAFALEEDLASEAMLARIRVWIIATPQGSPRVFKPKHGAVVYIDLP